MWKAVGKRKMLIFRAISGRSCPLPGRIARAGGRAVTGGISVYCLGHARDVPGRVTTPAFVRMRGGRRSVEWPWPSSEAAGGSTLTSAGPQPSRPWSQPQNRATAPRADDAAQLPDEVGQHEETQRQEPGRMPRPDDGRHEEQKDGGRPAAVGQDRPESFPVDGPQPPDDPDADRQQGDQNAHDRAQGVHRVRLARRVGRGRFGGHDRRGRPFVKNFGKISPGGSLILADGQGYP